jgi:hypothetical protein
MSVNVRILEQDFTPAEAAMVSGVSVAQQRDWRRRGLLPEKNKAGWSRFSISEVINLSVMHLFTRAGVSPSNVSKLRNLAVLPTLTGIYDNQEGYEFVGDSLDREARWQIWFTSRGDHRPPIIVVTTDDDGNVVVHRANAHTEIAGILETVGVPNCVVLDCYQLANRLVRRTHGPLIQIKVTAGPDKSSPGDLPAALPSQNAAPLQPKSNPSV